jgi:tRNA A37 N6-isopentenylltransferase MiaA
MKILTRQYSKRQLSWIRNKLLPQFQATDCADHPMKLFLLNATGTCFDAPFSRFTLRALALQM